MLTDAVSLSIAPGSARIDSCELCASGPESLRSWVVVRHARGGTVQLAACDRCTTAVRRIIAIAGGATAAGPAQLAAVTELSPTTASVELAAVDVVAAPALVRTLSEPFRAEDGATYTVAVVGQERSDGTWIGWLEFVGDDGHTARRTARETTQSSQEHLAYWATGLQPSYLEGAFSRAS
jgi:hypothetical protein